MLKEEKYTYEISELHQQLYCDAHSDIRNNSTLQTQKHCNKYTNI